jgi:oligosaccharide repeat unit polymerase
VYDVLLFANLLLWLGVTFYYVKHPAASVFHPVTFYLFFHGFIFTLRPFLVHYREYDGIYRAYQFAPSMDDRIAVLVAVMVGLVCFVLPCLKAGASPPRFAQDRFNEAERKEMIRPYLFAAAIIVPLGLISALANWDTRSNDSTTMILDAATGHTINTTSNGYFDNLQLMLAPITVMCVWLYRFRWWSFLPLLSFVVLRAGTGGRWPFVMACGAVALLYLYEKRRKWPDLRSALIGAIGLTLFSYVGADRGASIRKLFVEDNSFTGAFGVEQDLRLFEGMDFANLEYFEYLVYVVPQRSGTYGYFLDNLQIFTQPIPRVFWPGKPIGPPIQLFSMFDYGYPIGMTYSLPGEGWVQLGYLGVAIWCGLFGWLFGKAYNRFQTSLHGNPAVLAYLLFLPLSLTFFRDGFLLTLIQTVAFFLVPVWLVTKMAHYAAVPLADEMRLSAYRRVTRRKPDIAAKIQARQRRGKRTVLGRTGWPAE